LPKVAPGARIAALGENQRDRGDPHAILSRRTVLGAKIVKLYSYFRSSAAYRTRIALNLKGIAYETIAIHLTKDGGKQHSAEFRAVNPQMRVPALALDNGEVLLQSLAIIEYLDEVHPDPPLLPRDPVARAHVRAVAEIIACDIHPLNNTSPLNYLRSAVKAENDAVREWYHHWILTGFEAVEQLIRPGPFAFGATPSLADICLVPQVANARRFKVPIERFTKIIAVDEAANRHPAFDAARPERQPDAE
jgi:maleylacetoacetate isomerase